jgi:hypothetical protein
VLLRAFHAAVELMWLIYTGVLNHSVDSLGVVMNLGVAAGSGGRLRLRLRVCVRYSTDLTWNSSLGHI